MIWGVYMLQLLQNAVYGTAMILAVTALRAALKDRLAPGARLALWGVCLFRLLTPAAPESVLSLWGLVRRAAPAEIGAQGAPAAPVPGPAPAAPVIYDPFAAAVRAAFPWGTVLAAVWLAVGSAVALWYAAGWLRTRRAVGCAIPVARGDGRYRFLPRFARLREDPMDGAPLTFGAARPTVVLSPGLEGEELECVLAHEGVHAARRDNLWHYAMAAALAVHWWNPAVWVMSRLLRRDVELSCDRAALKKLGEGRRAQYAQALVTMATQTEGPAFCQTFGRKATEERILSIMKFKKTTVLGMVLSLVLVAGITIAFASDPKSDDTVEFHGETFHRSQLSQETLEWLDWYLALPEGEQMAVDYVPADLRSAAAPGVYDADAPVPGGEDSTNGRCSVFYDGNVVTRVVIPLDFLEEELDLRVDGGSMSRARADLILSQARSIAVDGVIDWTFEEDGGLRHEVLKEQSNETTTVSANGYWDKDGSFVKVGFPEIVEKFILPWAVMGELKDVNYDVEVRSHIVVDADGNSLVYDGNGELIAIGTAPVRVPDSTGNITPEEYAAMLEQWVGQGAMGRAEADKWLEFFQTAYDRVQAGDTAGFDYNIYDGSKLSVAWYIDHQAAAKGYPVNSRGETYGSHMPEVYGCSPDLIAALGTNGEEGYVRNSELNDSGYPGGVHSPEEALAYMEWLETQPATRYIPLYDCEGNVIGRFGVSNPTGGNSAGDAGRPVCSYPTAENFVGTVTAAGYPVCHIDGCTAVGRHTHDGATYCGGEAHHGETCDGSCTYNTLASTPAGSHHGEGHHGSGHH